jgi:hypothetical protein
MKKILGALTLAGLLTAGIVNAGTITVAHSDLEVDGALTAGYLTTDNDVVRTKDSFHITSADIKITNKIDNVIGFLLDMGRTYQSSVITPDLSTENRDFEIEIAYVSIKPLENLVIDAGLLATNIGYELYHPYENGNILFGMVWNAQPVTYTGARATFAAAPNLSLYAEYIQDPNVNIGVNPRDGFAVGVLGMYRNVAYALSFFDYAAYKNIVDFVLSTTIGSLDIGLNFDYQYLDDEAKNALKDAGATNIEDTAYGIAVYLTPHLTPKVSVPIRFEYVKDKDSTNAAGDVVDSGIYGVAGDYAYSVSVTPTWKPNEHSFVRAEVDFVKTDENSDNIFGTNEDSRTIYAVEAGYMF